MEAIKLNSVPKARIGFFNLGYEMPYKINMQSLPSRSDEVLEDESDVTQVELQNDDGSISSVLNVPRGNICIVGDDAQVAALVRSITRCLKWSVYFTSTARDKLDILYPEHSDRIIFAPYNFTTPEKLTKFLGVTDVLYVLPSMSESSYRREILQSINERYEQELFGVMLDGASINQFYELRDGVCRKHDMPDIQKAFSFHFKSYNR